MPRHTFEDELTSALPGLEIDKLPLTYAQRCALGRYRRTTVNHIPVILLCIDLPQSLNADAYLIINNYAHLNKKAEVTPEQIYVNNRGTSTVSAIREKVLDYIKKIENSWIVVYPKTSYMVGNHFQNESCANVFSDKISNQLTHHMLEEYGVYVYAPGEDVPCSKTILGPHHVIVETFLKGGEKSVDN